MAADESSPSPSPSPGSTPGRPAPGGLPIHRLLDASANRAREGLRVLEDAARFVLDDAGLSRRAKIARHDLRAALDRLPAGVLEANRDTAGDVGTVISTAAEGERAGTLAVAAAAGKRVGEALRSLEEWGKTLDPEMAAAIEALRYRVYDLERDVLARFGAGGAAQWPVCVLLTECLCRRPWLEVLDAAIEGGAACIQIREKELATDGLVRRVRAVVERARPAGVAVVVNDRVDVALAAGADGVHLGTGDLSLADARRLAGRTLLVGASTHDLDEAAAAVAAGADYCGVGAMFATALKPERTPSGPAYLRAFRAVHPRVAHLAIGGVTPATIGALVEAGARGVAVSAAVCGADDPGAVVAALVEVLRVPTPVGAASR